MIQVFSRLFRVLAVVSVFGFTLPTCRASGSLPPLPTAKINLADLVQEISHGERVDIQKNLREGRWTVISFKADWCGSCRALEPSLTSVINEKQTVALRQINIASWESPVALQYHIDSIPRLYLYDGTHLISTSREDVMKILRQ